MAALIRHGSLANSLKSTSALVLANTTDGRCAIKRGKKTVAKIPKKQWVKFEATQQSLAARGFLRPTKAYEPPQGVKVRIEKICRMHGLEDRPDTKLEDLEMRFKIFTACENEIKYSIPNSLLCQVETIADLMKFYSTPIDTATPLEALRKMDLPANLHVTYNYHRFHPDTDTMFDGKTAFPTSSTLVTGLKYKKKYPGHMQKDPHLKDYLRV